jgi:hypothetical protein
MRLHHGELRSIASGFRLGILSLLAGMLCASCGQAEETAIAPLDACALLTQADVEAAFGTTVGEPTRRSSSNELGWASMCNYDNTQTDAPVLSVGLLIRVHGAEDPAQGYSGYVQELRKALGEAAVPVPVEGLAGPAGWDGETNQLTVFVGPYQMILTTGGRFGGDRLSAAQQLAERVSGRLPPP